MLRGVAAPGWEGSSTGSSHRALTLGTECQECPSHSINQQPAPDSLFTAAASALDIEYV